MKRLISILLVVVMLAIALASCGPAKPAATTTASTTPPAATTTGSTQGTGDAKWETLATNVKAMDAELRSLKFEMSDMTANAYDTKNKEYIAGPDSPEGASAISRLVYERNKEASELLGITIEYELNSSGWGAAHQNISRVCTSADIKGAPDMFVNMMYDMVGAALSSSFRDLLTIEGSYFDFEEEGWFYDIMSDMSFSRERVYLMASDYFVDVLRNMMLMPFNLSMLDTSQENQALVDALTGGAYQSGEYLSDYLFDLVKDGKWTYDKLLEICEKIYKEGDSVSGDSEGDILGIYLDAAGGNMASAFLYSTDIPCLADTLDANGAVTALTYPATGEQMNKVFQAIDKLVKGTGTLVAQTDVETNKSEVINNMIRAKFAKGEVFCDGVELLGSFEADVYQKDMRDIFSVVPVPLLAEGSVDDHNTPIHNCAMVGGINIQSQKYLAISAFVQYCTEHEKTQEIRYEYLEIAMKYDMFEHNPGTDDMLDIIYDNIDSCREMIIDNVVCRLLGLVKVEGVPDARWHGYLKTDDFGNAGNFLAIYESLLSAKQSAVTTALENWYKLPKGAASVTE